MGRFLVCDIDEARQYDDPDEWTVAFAEDAFTWDYVSFLVDTEAGIVVFSDQMEPEDARLDRSLQPLVRYMEEIIQHA